MDIQAIKAGLATAADAVAGLNVHPDLPGAISTPVFAPVEYEVGYHGTFGAAGLVKPTVTCGIYVPDTPEGRALLAGYLQPSGPTSVPAALEADKTLGGVAKTLIVRKARGVGRMYTVGNSDYMGAMLDVEVYA